MKTENNTKGKYGEPWITEAGCSAFVIDAYGEEVATFDDPKDAARAVQCINACDGIEDPAEALEYAREALKRAGAYARMVGASTTASACLSALAKLNPSA